MSYELAQKYAAFEVPAELKHAHRAGVQLAGSLTFTKMMLFANENQITNDDIDRRYLYDYTVFENQN